MFRAAATASSPLLRSRGTIRASSPPRHVPRYEINTPDVPRILRRNEGGVTGGREFAACCFFDERR